MNIIKTILLNLAIVTVSAILAGIIVTGISAIISPAANAATKGFHIEGAVLTTDSSVSAQNNIYETGESGYSYSFGYSFNQYFTVQLSKIHTGNFYPLHGSSKILEPIYTSAEVAALGLSGIASIPIGYIDLYARAGLSRWDSNSQVRTPDFMGRVEESGASPFYGLGISAKLLPELFIGAEIMQINAGVIKNNALSVNLRINF